MEILSPLFPFLISHRRLAVKWRRRPLAKVSFPPLLSLSIDWDRKEEEEEKEGIESEMDEKNSTHDFPGS